MLSYWWKEYAECSEGPKGPPETSEATLDAESVEPFPVDEERVGVPVKGGLYEVSFGLKYLNLVLTPPINFYHSLSLPLISEALFSFIFIHKQTLYLSWILRLMLCRSQNVWINQTRHQSCSCLVCFLENLVCFFKSGLDWTNRHPAQNFKP